MIDFAGTDLETTVNRRPVVRDEIRQEVRAELAEVENRTSRLVTQREFEEIVNGIAVNKGLGNGRVSLHSTKLVPLVRRRVFPANKRRKEWEFWEISVADHDYRVNAKEVEEDYDFTSEFLILSLQSPVHAKTSRAHLQVLRLPHNSKL
jgi:hypothetical protein